MLTVKEKNMSIYQILEAYSSKLGILKSCLFLIDIRDIRRIRRILEKGY